MFAIFLLLLAVSAASAAKCPENFFHFDRTPTAENNHTKEWCMGLFSWSNMGNRNRARSVCNYYNATLTLPENQYEYDFLKNLTEAKKFKFPHAIDGEVSTRCMAQLLKDSDFNSFKDTGDCNIKKNLFAFDSANTDPSFIKNNHKNPIPQSREYLTEYHYPVTFSNAATCLILTQGISNTNYCYDTGSIETDEPLFKKKNVTTVLCGRHP